MQDTKGQQRRSHRPSAPRDKVISGRGSPVYFLEKSFPTAHGNSTVSGLWPWQADGDMAKSTYQQPGFGFKREKLLRVRGWWQSRGKPGPAGTGGFKTWNAARSRSGGWEAASEPDVRAAVAPRVAELMARLGQGAPSQNPPGSWGSIPQPSPYCVYAICSITEPLRRQGRRRKRSGATSPSKLGKCWGREEGLPEEGAESARS